MGVAPDERARVLHNRKETRQVMDFSVRVSAVHDTGKVEEMSTLVQLRPKSPLESLLGVLECLRLAEEIKMGQDTKDVTRHTSSGKDVEKLHSLHLKAKVSINHQEDDVGNLCDVDHSLELVGALDEGQSLLLGRNNCNGTLRVRYRLFGISSNERLHQSRLSYTGRANDGNKARRGLIGQSVDERDMKTLLFDLSMIVSIVELYRKVMRRDLHLAI